MTIFGFNAEKDAAIDMPVAAAIIARGTDEGNEILVIRRSAVSHWPLMWEVPRGKCDKKGEKLYGCLRREVKEETDLDINPLRYIGKFSYLADGGERKSTQYNFLCSLKDWGQEIKLNPKEHDQFKWINNMGQIDLVVTKELSEIISQALVLDLSNISVPAGQSDVTIAEYLDLIQEK